LAIAIEPSKLIANFDDDAPITEIGSADPGAGAGGAGHVRPMPRNLTPHFVSDPSALAFKIRGAIKIKVRSLLVTTGIEQDRGWSLSANDMDDVVNHIMMLVTSLHPIVKDPDQPSGMFVADQHLRDGAYPETRSILMHAVQVAIKAGPRVTDEPSNVAVYHSNISSGVAKLMQAEERFGRQFRRLLPSEETRRGAFYHDVWDGAFRAKLIETVVVTGPDNIGAILTQQIADHLQSLSEGQTIGGAASAADDSSIDA
jgi:hypothetical protein